MVVGRKVFQPLPYCLTFVHFLNKQSSFIIKTKN